jgi:hypothetical protein
MEKNILVCKKNPSFLTLKLVLYHAVIHCSISHHLIGLSMHKYKYPRQDEVPNSSTVSSADTSPDQRY